jgi:CBS-domain-containing membrane protein
MAASPFGRLREKQFSGCALMYLVTGVHRKNENDKVSYPAVDARQARAMFEALSKDGYFHIKIIDDNNEFIGLIKLSDLIGQESAKIDDL